MQIMKAGVIAVILAGSLSTAQAATRCYRTADIEADQAVRFQTQLMVLSDSCGSNSYTQFTRHNGGLLAAYQKTMIDFFRRESGSRAETVFDRFITALANKTALKVGEQPIAAVCSRSADFLTKAGDFGHQDFERYVERQAEAQRGNYRSCKN